MLNKIGFHPWFSIWSKPKATIRKIVDFDPNYRLFILSTIYGFSSLISLAQTFALGNVLNSYLILIACVILSPIWGYLIFSFASFFIYLSGKLLKGKALYSHIRCAIAWSNVPMIVNALSWIFLFIVFKENLLKEFPEGFPFNDFQKSFLFLVLFSQLIFSIWILVLYINSLAEVQQFSVGKAILNIIVAVLLFLVLFFFIAIVYHLILERFIVR